MTIKQGATKKSIIKLLENLSKELKSNGVDEHKYVGKINLKRNALNIQKELRGEWE
ncbi:hypothetical protein [Paucihalobacter sp.]|uniref:hypothetical protein n=1 Tax=Paucihalobacter sp. TaxID=2850405 RepID=UPI002FE3371C